MRVWRVREVTREGACLFKEGCFLMFIFFLSVDSFQIPQTQITVLILLAPSLGGGAGRLHLGLVPHLPYLSPPCTENTSVRHLIHWNTARSLVHLAYSCPLLSLFILLCGPHPRHHYVSFRAHPVPASEVCVKEGETIDQ